MKFTRSILKHFLPLENVSSEVIYKTLNKIGLEVESFQKICAPKKVVVGKILECQKHPDATKLNVCQVAVSGSEGNYEIRQIVCGAPNARAGIFVAVALEGAILPQVTIKKAVLRGVESCGMLCSTTELGFPAINDGIVELDGSIGVLEIGKELLEYPHFNDEVYEVSITPNRGDCMSLIGIARDLSVALNLERKPLESLKSTENAPGIGRVLQITAEKGHDSSLLYCAMETEPIVIPLCVSLFLAYNDSLAKHWLLNTLNFSTLVSGVILNAYPQTFCQLGKASGENKVVLNLQVDELGFESVYHNGKKLSVIGIKSCLNEESLRDLGEGREFIILEASYIPPKIIAQKVLETKSKSKVDPKVFQRTARGSNPNLQMGFDVLGKLLCCEDVILYSDSQELIATQNCNPITISIPLIAKTIGTGLDRTKVVQILQALEFKIEIPVDENLLVVTPPPFRHDISSYQDVAEEVIRFIGIDEIPSQPLVLIQGNQNNAESNFYRFKRQLAKKAIGVNFNESVHFVFQDKQKLQRYGFEVLKDELELLNPITNELNTLRSTLLLGLLEAARLNKNNGFNGISLMEVGEVYDSNRNQSTKIAFLQSGLVAQERYPNAKGIKGDYFAFANRISRVIGEFSLQETQSKVGIFHPGECAKMIYNNQEIGILSALHPQIAEEFGLEDTYLCEVDLEKLSSKNPQVEMYSKFQKITRDLSVVVNKTIPYYRLKETISSLNIPVIVGFYPLDIYKDDNLKESISLTIRFELQSHQKTLEEKDIGSVMDQVLEALAQNHKVVLR